MLTARSQAISAGTATTSSSKTFMPISASIRLARMSRGGIGMDNSSSLSLASNSCAFAVKTLPKAISAKAIIAYIAK